MHSVDDEAAAVEDCKRSREETKGIAVRILEMVAISLFEHMLTLDNRCKRRKVESVREGETHTHTYVHTRVRLHGALSLTKNI